MGTKDVIFPKDQTLEEFGKTKQPKGTDDGLTKLIPIPSSSQQPRQEERVDESACDTSHELTSDNSSVEMSAYEPIEQGGWSLH